MIASSLPSRRPLLLVSALCLLLPRALWATDTNPSVVILRTSSCATPHQEAALRHALEVELAAMHVEPRWEEHAAGAPTVSVSLSAECTGEPSVLSLRVWSSVPRLVLERTVLLRDVQEEARARTLALVIAEALGPALAAASGCGSEERAPCGRVEPSAPAGVALGASVASVGPLFTTADPYGPWGNLITLNDPYVTPRPRRLATAAQARLTGPDTVLLLAFEVGASGPLTQEVDWGIEASYAAATAWLPERALDVEWWNASIGADLVAAGAVSYAIGPRLSLGHLTIADPLSDVPTERTLVPQLGGRAKLDARVGDRSSVQTMLAAQRTLGVLALTDYTGLDQAVQGWVFSWGMGLAVEL